MANFDKAWVRFAFCTVSTLVAAGCSGATEADDSGRLSDGDLIEAGAGDGGVGQGDDDLSMGGTSDDDTADPGDIGVDDDTGDDDSSDDDTSDDDTSDDDVSSELDASVLDGSVEMPPGTLPGGGFVTIDTGDGGTFEILCGSDTCACADNADNDGDGLSDGADSECTGPFDNDETSFATGIPGDNRDPKWQDCFFDGNSGAGDDGCRYHTDCLTGEADLDSDDCSVTDQCRDYCAPLTPPGCDCFGCCQVAIEDGSVINIVASDTCSLENIDDEAACQRCVPTDACSNECGECEICLGETLADLPESCFPPPPDGSGGSSMGGGSSSGGASSGGSGTGGNGVGGEPASGGGANSAGAPNGSGGSPEEPPTEPPPNVCDGNASPCFVSDDCGSGQYCSLGCCKTIPAR